jgi:hypothetical protein
MHILLLCTLILTSGISCNQTFLQQATAINLISASRSPAPINNRPDIFGPVRPATAGNTTPSRDTTPVTVNSSDISGLEEANDSITSALDTIQSANLAVQAAVSAVATCKTEGIVDCQQLKTLYNKTTEYINVASNSMQQANASASNTINISNKAKGLLLQAQINAQAKINAKFSDLAAQIAQSALMQAKVAATAVASAAAQCSVIVQIRCNECPAAAPENISVASVGGS